MSLKALKCQLNISIRDPKALMKALKELFIS